MTRLLLFMLLFSAHEAFGQKTVYVSQAATGANDGTSWTDAFVYLQDGLAVAASDDEIWVAQGVYRPDQGAGITLGDRLATFVIPTGLSVFGGFQGFESTVGERDPTSRSTLSGDLLQNDSPGSPPLTDSLRADNSTRLLRSGSSDSGLTVLDGVSLRGAESRGSEISGPCTLRRVDLVENRGSAAARIVDCSASELFVARNRTRGAALWVSGSSRITDSLFEDNRASGPAGGGGALALSAFGADTVRVSRSSFFRNEAEDGGAIWVSPASSSFLTSIRLVANQARCGGGALLIGSGSQVTIVNVLATHNVAQGQCSSISGGGAILVFEGTLEAANSTFVENQSTNGSDAIRLFRSNAILSNTIVSANGDVASNDFETDGGTLSVAHLRFDGSLPSETAITGPIYQGLTVFRDPAGPDQVVGTLDDDYGLPPGSPAVDRGDNALIPLDLADLDSDGEMSEITPTDLVGKQRVQGFHPTPLVDMGAFESPGITSLSKDPIPAEWGCDVSVYPNPVRDRVTIESDSPEETIVWLFDILGRQVYMTRLPAALRFDLSLSPLVSGHYFMRFTKGSRHCSQKLIIRNR